MKKASMWYKGSCDTAFGPARRLFLTEQSVTQNLLFSDLFKKPVSAQFDQEHSSSDGGAILLKAADRQLGLIERLAGCMSDSRQSGK
ncbi:MAG: hypothetical protein ACR2L2_20615, partial [Acidobacteriota bacterium]